MTKTQKDSLKVLLRLARFKRACRKLPAVTYPNWVKVAANKQGIKFN